MTICIATSNYFPDTGGISTYSQRLAALLQMEGHKAIVLTIDFNNGIREPDSITYEKNGAMVVRLRESFQRYYNYYGAFFRPGGIDASYWIAMGKSMHDWLATNHKIYNIDIFEASAFGGIGAFLIQPDLPPVALSGHGAFFQYKKYNSNKEDEQSRLIEKMEKSAFLHADGLISHSPQSQQDIANNTDKKVFLAKIPILFENKETDELQKINLARALVVGSLQKLKGPETLCKALTDKRIQKSCLEVIWAGSDNYNHETGKKMSEHLSKKYPEVWGKKLIWEDSPDDKRLSVLFSEASFIIIPTIWESFNVISIEAASYKKPVIITDKTGSSFLFKNGQNAIIIPAEDVNALADAIAQLSESSSTCNKLGNAAYNEIAMQLTSNRIIDERIRIYTEIIASKDPLVKSPDLSFLKKYTTVTRRLYFAFRKLIKKLLYKK